MWTHQHVAGFTWASSANPSRWSLVTLHLRESPPTAIGKWISNELDLVNLSFGNVIFLGKLTKITFPNLVEYLWLQKTSLRLLIQEVTNWCERLNSPWPCILFEKCIKIEPIFKYQEVPPLKNLHLWLFLRIRWPWEVVVPFRCGV